MLLGFDTVSNWPDVRMQSDVDIRYMQLATQYCTTIVSLVSYTHVHLVIGVGLHIHVLLVCDSVGDHMTSLLWEQY